MLVAFEQVNKLILTFKPDSRHLHKKTLENHFYILSKSRNMRIARYTRHFQLLLESFMLKWSIPFMITLFLLTAGCAPNHLFIEEGVVETIDEHLVNQKVQLNQISDDQKLLLEEISASQQTVISRLQQTIAEQVKPPACPPTPVMACPPVNPSSTIVLGGIEKQVVGELEKVHLSPLDIVFNARVDTGATTSSLDARNVQRFERDGRRWVRFDITHPETAEVLTFERPVVRRIRVSQAISDDYERRTVVELHFTLGGISHTAEFSLSDRSHLDFPVLIGRNILRDQMLVDVSKQYIAPIEF